jgi:large subunit ribosomal protein L4
MPKLNTYSSKGIKKTATNMPKDWQEKENLILLAQAVRVYEDRSHTGLSKVKTRGEVKASTRKIYRQKGTGQARHGALSAPIFVGGGITHGPKGKKRTLKLPDKMKAKALKVALSLKAKDGQLVFVDGLSSLKKSKDVATLINKIATKEKIEENPRYTVALSNKNNKTKKILRNLKNVDVVDFNSLNAYKVFFGGYLLVDKDAIGEKKEKKESEKEAKAKKGTKK